jgi:succinyl-CoA synthetase beta subunit
MMVHEFQAKRILASFDVPIPRGETVESVSEIGPAASRIGPRVVLKAQIHAGGRGKAGGVKIASGPDEAVRAGSAMIGMRLVTAQTGPAGRIVRKILIEEALEIEHEYYLGITVDRSKAAVVMLASAFGGLDIESLAAERPQALLREFIDPGHGLVPAQSKRLAVGLGLRGDILERAMETAAGMSRAFMSLDVSLIEVNPLAVTARGNLVALDAKMVFDDNGLPRHPEIAALRDVVEESPFEVEAARYGLSYVKLDGEIGAMVNGAGLAMATMDIIALHGGRPANFLDIGGGVSETGIAQAFKILVSDADVKAVLVNIFGGIVRCDLVARGLVQAARETGVSVPVVIRLEGTNAELGKKILEDSGVAFTRALDMESAAKQVVALAGRLASEF